LNDAIEIEKYIERKREIKRREREKRKMEINLQL